MLDVKDRWTKEIGENLNVNIDKGVIYLWTGYDAGEVRSYKELVKLITYLQDVQKEILS